jgi:hypothetical protein
MSKLADHTGTAAETFAGQFAAGWAAGGPADRFVAHFTPLCAPEILLVQPLSRPLRGVDGLRRLAEPLFAAMPDLRGEMARWGPTEDGLMVELVLRGTLGRGPAEWTTVDRIVLRDGLMAERRAYFDPTPLLSVMLRSPRPALPLLRGMRARKEHR